MGVSHFAVVITGKCSRLTQAIIFNLQHTAPPMDNITSGTELHAGSPVAFGNVFKLYFSNLHR